MKKVWFEGKTLISRNNRDFSDIVILKVCNVAFYMQRVLNLLLEIPRKPGGQSKEW